MAMHRRCMVLIYKPVWKDGNGEPSTGTPVLTIARISLPASVTPGELGILAVAHVAASGEACCSPQPA